ncbi:DUF4097 family beta strand repeat-containing protein [Paenibacillus sp. GCM10027626]|uniref:DUF4097 family beta strand repeat-containing protein n=1 Tax=Paenibacillus sp. GCM10027626 TaxID=3273411 RepID=UPI00363C4412
MLRKKRRHFIPMLALTTTLLIAGCSTKSEANSTPSNDSNIQTLYKGQELSIDKAFSKVKIATDLFAVRVEPSTDSSAHINLDTASDNLQEHFDINVQSAGDELNVSIKGKKKLSLNLVETYKTHKSEVVVKLPEHDYQLLDLQSNVGKISYSNVDGQQLNISTDAGEVEVDNAAVKQAKIENSVGLVSLSGVTGAIEVKNNTGAVNVKNETIQDDLTISNDVGAVTVETLKEPEKFKLDLSTDVGNIETNWQADFNSKSRRTVEGVKSTDGPLIKVQTAVGIIKVNTAD